MEYYSAMKRNNIGLFVEMWMELETIIQSQSEEKKTLYVNAYIWNQEKWYR